MAGLADSPAAFAFSRSCSFLDFGGCHSAAEWQERLALASYAHWAEQAPHGTLVVVNWSQSPFRSLPGALHLAVPPKRLEPLAGLVLLGVLDRLAAPVQTLKHLLPQLLPGGLLFATVAYWDADGKDCAEGHEERKRIYNREGLRRLIQEDLRKVGMQTLGPIDWTYHGHVLGDHTLHSVVLVKREGKPLIEVLAEEKGGGL